MRSPHRVDRDRRAGLDDRVGIHVHNDAGAGVANTLAAVQPGARQVQGTINGYGERCGNANLCTIGADLALKMGMPTAPPGALAGLTELSRFVAEVANLRPDNHSPTSGASASRTRAACTARRRRASATRTSTSTRRASATRRGWWSASSAGGRARVARRAAWPPLEGQRMRRTLSDLIKRLEARGRQLRGGGGVVRAAHPARPAGLRAAVPAPRLHGHRRAARRPRRARGGDASRSRSTARSCTRRPMATAP